MATDASSTGFAGPDAPPSWRLTQVLGVQVAVSANVFAAALELKPVPIRSWGPPSPPPIW
jgi:hypothetical protein